MAALRSAVQHEVHGPALALAASARFLRLRARPMWTVRLEAETLGITAAQASGNSAAEVFLRGFRGDTLSNLQRWAEAEADFTSILTVAGPGRQVGLLGLGNLHMQQGRQRQAREYYRQVVPLARQTGDARAESVAECNLAAIAVQLGEHDQALVHAERELALRRQAGDRVGEAYAFYSAATARQGMAEYAIALELAEQAMALYRDLEGTEGLVAQALNIAASCLEHLGDLTLAASYLQKAAGILTTLEDPGAEAARRRSHELAASADRQDLEHHDP